MNGRVYDPEIARFISADPVLSDPTYLQSYNRYSYVWNNPLRMTDPSGFEPHGTGTDGYDSHPNYDHDNNRWDHDKDHSKENKKWDKEHKVEVTKGDKNQTVIKDSSGNTLYDAGERARKIEQQKEWDQWALENPIPPESGLGTVSILGLFPARAVSSGLFSGVANRGWKLGDDIYNLTTKGNQPSWTTVRTRFWKNESTMPSAANKYGAENVERMAKGRAPQRYNADKGGIESMELSHEPIPFRGGGKDFIPRWPQDHAAVDPFRRPGY